MIGSTYTKVIALQNKLNTPEFIQRLTELGCVPYVAQSVFNATELNRVIKECNAKGHTLIVDTSLFNLKHLSEITSYLCVYDGSEVSEANRQHVFNCRTSSNSIKLELNESLGRDMSSLKIDFRQDLGVSITI